MSRYNADRLAETSDAFGRTRLYVAGKVRGHARREYAADGTVIETVVRLGEVAVTDEQARILIPLLRDMGCDDQADDLEAVIEPFQQPRWLHQECDSP